MAEMTYLQAISDGLRQEMRRDQRVFVLGEDVGVYGGAFKVTLGFQEEFGSWRVIDTPLSETAIVGGATGAAMMGLRPVAEMQFADFVSCAWDHLVTVAAKQRWRAGTPVPFVLRLPSGGGFSGGPFHSQNPESSFAHIPGLKCVCPATPEDAKGLIIAAIEDPNPVLFFEHKHLYRRIKGEVPEERYTVPIGKARIHPEGDRRVGDHVGRDGLHRRGGRGAGRRVRRDRRPPQRDAVGQAGGARLGPQDVEGARAPRRHPLGRLRRRDRRDDRGGGLRGSRRAGSPHRGAGLARARSRRCSRRPSSHRSPTSRGGSRNSWSTRSEDGHRYRCRRRDAPDGRLGFGGHGHPLAEAGRRPRRVGRDAARDLDRQGRHRGAVARRPASSARSSCRRARRSRSGRCSHGSAARRLRSRQPHRRRRRATQPATPEPRHARARQPTPEPVAAAPPPAPPAAAAHPRRPSRRTARPFISPVVARIAGEHGVDPAQVPGTGTGGRVTKKDILAFIEAGGAAAPEPSRPGPRRGRAPPPAAPVRLPHRRTADAASRSARPRRRSPRAPRRQPRRRARRSSRCRRCAAASPSTCAARSTRRRT